MFQKSMPDIGSWANMTIDRLHFLDKTAALNPLRQKLQRTMWLLFFCFTLICILCGCVHKKSPQALRQENMLSDLALLKAMNTKEKSADKKQNETTKASQIIASTVSDPIPPKMGQPPRTPPPVLRPTGPISLEDAINYALAHNFEALASAQEKKVNDELATGAVYRLLPSLLLETEQSWKSREIPSFSESFKTKAVSLEPSVSSDQRTNTFNSTLSWDLLNLAVNVYKWRQAKKSVETAAERHRRIKQNVVLDVTEAYMRAAVAKNIAEKAESLIAKAENRTQILEKEISEDLIPVIDGLQNQIYIMEMRIRFESYEDDYKAAMTSLRELMGIVDKKPLEIEDVDFATLPEKMELDAEKFEQNALKNRPELFERDLEQQIALDEANAAMLRLFPEVSPFSQFSYDGNSYLSRHTWVTTGLRISWDLLSMPGTFHDRAAALEQATLEEKRRLMLSMAVLTQVQLAMLSYEDAYEKLPLIQELTEKRKRLMNVVGLHVTHGKLHESLLLGEDQNYLTSYLLYLDTYAELVISQARINNAMGMDWDSYRGYAPRVSSTQGSTNDADLTIAVEPQQ